MFTDIHTHAYHPKIAHKVLAQLEGHYGISPVGDGTVDDLLARAANANIDMVAIHTAATDPSQVVPANNWALELNATHQNVRAFGTMHVDYQDPEKEFDRLYRKGVHGLKFHCDFQGFFMDDPRFLRLLEIAADRFLIMLHVGDVPKPEDNPSCPMKTASLLDAFPGTTFIAAHLGGYLHWDYALEVLCGRDVYLDTSSALDFMDDRMLQAIFDKHPRERILFGSDYPLFDPKKEAEILQQRLALTDPEMEQILSAGTKLLNYFWTPQNNPAEAVASIGKHAHSAATSQR